MDACIHLYIHISMDLIHPYIHSYIHTYYTHASMRKVIHTGCIYYSCMGIVCMCTYIHTHASSIAIHAYIHTYIYYSCICVFLLLFLHKALVGWCSSLLVPLPTHEFGQKKALGFLQGHVYQSSRYLSTWYPSSWMGLTPFKRFLFDCLIFI